MTIPRRNKQNYADFTSDNMASSYDNSSEEQTELRRLHHKLISEINDDLDQNSIEYENLIFHFGNYLPRRFIANKSSLDLFETLRARNIIRPGENYETLKQICRDSGNHSLVNTIEKYEKEMEKVRTQHRYTGPQETEKKHTESKRKFTALETEQKEEIKRLMVEVTPQQKQLENEKTKSDQTSDHFSAINVQEKSSEWDRCITRGSETAAKQLIDREILPSQRELHNACRVFGVDSHIISKICSMISNHIIKKSENVIDVWPSYQNDHVFSSSYVSIVFVVVVKKNSIYLVSKDNYECYIKSENDSSEMKIVAVKEMESDPSDIQSSNAVLEKIRKCVNKNADDLLKKHSNLNVILPSLMKSVGYTSGKHDIKIKPCIALYVSVKGYIPLNETPFEKEIDGFQTDVLEGEFEPFIGGPNHYHEHLKMGVAIHANVSIGNEIFGGTLGGFINHSVHGLCGITSAHVVCDSAELARMKDAKVLSLQKKVYQPIDAGIDKSMSAFGEVVLAIYNEGTESESGMEVALMSIKKRQPKDGSFPEAFNDNEAGFDLRDQLCFNSGEVREISAVDKWTAVFKFGMSSGITRGGFDLYGGVVRKSLKGHSKSFGYYLKNQIMILQLGDIPFAKKGDSGALVFIKGTLDFAAIGIVEGGMGCYVFVTPICDILTAVGCTKMCQFTPGCNAVLTDSGDEMDVS